MENQGWISLHRKLIDWEWYQNSNVKCLFLHLLLTANFKEKQWKGITIKRGQVLVGRGELSKILGLSEQQVRTAKNKLKSTNEITSQPTNRYSIITVLNYDLYQDNNQQLNQQITNKQPTDNQQITTTNNDNNNNKDNNEINNISKDILTLVDKQNTSLTVKENTGVTKTEKVNYGNQSINELLTYMKKTLELPALSDTIMMNRRQASNLIKQIMKENDCEEEKAVVIIKKIIDIIPSDAFWGRTISDFVSLKKNWVKVLNSVRGEQKNDRKKFAVMD